MPFNATFDATAIKPEQGGGGSISPGIHDFAISNTSVETLNGDKGGTFIVEISTAEGTAKKWFNLWFENKVEPQKAEKTKELAAKQLSALCHAVGVFRLDFNNDAAALRGARGKVLMAYQAGHDPALFPDGKGYTEIKMFLDAAGNEPGKPATGGAMPAQTNNGFTAAPAAAPATAPAASGPTWGNSAAPSAAPPWGQQS